jgi:heavy metal translocating P-type ATPase
MPITDLSMSASMLPAYRYPGWKWVLLALCLPVLTWGAWPFYATAARQLWHRTWAMDTLVSLGILASAGWSLYTMFALPLPASTSLSDLFTHHASGALYLEVSAGVTMFLLAGRYVEATARLRGRRRLTQLLDQQGGMVTVHVDGVDEPRAVTDLRVGDLVVIGPGDRVPVDGVVHLGAAEIDQRSETGESLPVVVGPGDTVFSGSFSIDGRIVIAATEVGTSTRSARLAQVVDRALGDKAAVQRLADRVAGILVPVIVATSVATLLIWLALGERPGLAVNAAVSVVIIACPCALGLATPAALVAATSEGARRGIYFKRFSALEAGHRVRTVLIDKTGTLSTGRLDVVEVAGSTSASEDDVVALAAAVERASTHPVGRAIVAYAGALGMKVVESTEFRSRPGEGATATVGGLVVTVGPEAADDAHDLETTFRRWTTTGWGWVVVRRSGEVVGAVAFQDTLRPSARDAVDRLRRRGTTVEIISGDRPEVTALVAAHLGIDAVPRRLRPEEKLDLVERRRLERGPVAVVGDGVNDGPALAAADLGMALGAGSELAVDVADAVLLSDDLTSVVWAFGYNLVAVPIAALGLLNPLVAGAAMAASSLFVVATSSRLGRTLSTTMSPSR